MNEHWINWTHILYSRVCPLIPAFQYYLFSHDLWPSSNLRIAWPDSHRRSVFARTTTMVFHGGHLLISQVAQMESFRNFRAESPSDLFGGYFNDSEQAILNNSIPGLDLYRQGLEHALLIGRRYGYGVYISCKLLSYISMFWRHIAVR